MAENLTGNNIKIYTYMVYHSSFSFQMYTCHVHTLYDIFQCYLMFTLQSLLSTYTLLCIYGLL